MEGRPEVKKPMITVTVLTVYALGMIFAPGPTRAVLKALKTLIGTIGVVLLIFWRIFPSSAGASLRRF
jgi:hypothetical protein